jgi:major membrane immunogen (membrane-anchored lipoprotein)
MLKKLLLCLVLLLTLIFSSCSVKNEDTYDITYQDGTYSIDTVNKTILHEGQTYRYDISGAEITITYPDNSQYWWTKLNDGGYGGWSDNYDENKYVAGDILVKVLTGEIPTNKSEKNYLAVIILLALGIWSAVSPRSSWYLSHGWKYKNAEPSDIAITITRIGGILLILISVILIFV